MSLLEKAKQNPGWVVGALAFLAALTQFDKGLALVNSKWNADVMAGEAKQTAEGVRSDFDGYLSAQHEALSEQRAYQKAQAEFTKQLMVLQTQAANAPQRPTWRWQEEDVDGAWCCQMESKETCWRFDGWVRCDP